MSASVVKNSDGDVGDLIDRRICIGKYCSQNKVCRTDRRNGSGSEWRSCGTHHTPARHGRRGSRHRSICVIGDYGIGVWIKVGAADVEIRCSIFCKCSNELIIFINFVAVFVAHVVPFNCRTNAASCAAQVLRHVTVQAGG